MKLFVQTFLGIVALIAGVSLLYFFISELNTGFNFIFLALALVLIGVGAFLFIRVSKLANSVSESPAVQVAPAEDGSKLLEKNNQMVKDWTQANEKRDHLKSVQMAVSAEVNAKAEE